MLACSSHNSKATNFLPLQKSQPIASSAPAQSHPHIPLVNRGCHLPGLRHAFIKSLMSVIQLMSPEKQLHSKWKVTRSCNSTGGARWRAVQPEDTANLLLHIAKWVWSAYIQGGDGRDAEERKRVRRSETFRMSLPPCHWEGKWKVHARFLSGYSDILPICSTVVPITSKFQTELLAVPHWRPAGCPPTHQQVHTQHSWRSGLLLLVETRTRLNVASYKFLQQRASLQHVARNVAVAMVNIHV